MDAQAGPVELSSTDKFAVVLESAALNEAELAEYCRCRGLHPERVKAWRTACEQANEWQHDCAPRARRDSENSRKRIRELERELSHKDKALAEVAALLVQRNKSDGVWKEDGDL